MTDPIWTHKMNTNKHCLIGLWDGTEIYNGEGKLLKAQWPQTF